jgi:nonsense-mediated mRNA decay protein 3
VQVDITEGIPKEVMLQWCRNCNRYLQPPKNWVACDLESRELLVICIKRVKGLNKVKLTDAGFIWTEPHSRRLKVKLTVQKEVQLSFVFVVKPSSSSVSNRTCFL